MLSKRMLSFNLMHRTILVGRDKVFLAGAGIGYFDRDWTGTGINIVYLYIYGAIDSSLMFQVFVSYVNI